MKYVYHPQMDLMLEALSYLMIKTGETPLETTFSRLAMMCPQEEMVEPLKERIACVRSFYETVDRQYNLNAKDLAPFFTPFSIGQGNIALLLMLSFFEPTIPDWETQEKNIREKFEAFACADSQPLGKLHVANLMDDSNDDGQRQDGLSLVAQLDETGLKDEEKWSILRAIQNAGSQLMQLKQILLPALELISAHLSTVMPLLDDFQDRWNSYFQKNLFSAFLSQNIGIEPGDISDYTLHVYPSLFNAGSIVLNMDADLKNIYLYIGACLPEGLRVKDMPIENNQMLEGLKALSDKSKLSILAHIRDKRSYGQALAKETGLSTATISHHMSTLINCGFIHMERVENRIYYQMDKDSVKRFLKELSFYLLEGEGPGKART